MRRLALFAVLALPSLAWAQGAPRPFNIYASLNDDAQMGPAVQRIQTALQGCGIATTADGSMAYVGLASGFTIIVSGPHASREGASEELMRARGCGVEGYTRMAARRPGVLED